MADQIITIDFHGDTLLAFERKDQGFFVAVAPICRTLGIDPKRQRDRIQRDPILREGGAMMALPSGRGDQETLCLRIDLVNGWLLTIEVGRVRQDKRPLVIAYQRECHRVLFEHFYGLAMRHRSSDYRLEQRMEKLDRQSARLATTAMNAACRVIDTILHIYGPTVAAEQAPKILAKVGIFVTGTPMQGELELKIIDGGKPSC